MVAWSETERCNIRAYLGFPSLFHQIEPRLENAIQSVLAIADGGVLPDDSTQQRMRGVLTQLANIDAQITSFQGLTFINDAGTDKVNINATRAIFVLRMEGRRLITQLAIPLGTRPFRDYYSPLPLNSSFETPNSPFPTDLG